MDNAPAGGSAPDPFDRRPSAAFVPDGRLTALAAGAAVVAAALAAASDAAGRLLFALAAAVLAGYVVSDLVYRPRLAVDAERVRVRAPWGRLDAPWSAVDAVRADSRTRYGLRSVTLEIDAGDDLIVLSRRALGADPEHVADVVRSFDPRR